LKKVKAERFDRSSPGHRPDLEKLQLRHPADRDYPLGVNCGSMIGKVRDLLTVEGLAYTVYDEPEMVEDMVETCCLLIEDFLDAVLPHFAFDFASGWEDICYKSGPLVSIDFSVMWWVHVIAASETSWRPTEWTSGGWIATVMCARSFPIFWKAE